MVKFLDLLTTEDYTEPLREVARRFNEISVDRLQPKPVVKVTGEFWAQTTEGDGNFNMFRFLQAEGAEIITEPIATWLTYMMWQEKIKAKDRRQLDEADSELKWWEIKKRLQLDAKYFKKRAAMAFADKVYRREYDRIREALGGTTHALSLIHILGTCEVCANLVGDYAAAFGLPAETIEDGRDGPTPSRSCKPGT